MKTADLVRRHVGIPVSWYSLQLKNSDSLTSIVNDVISLTKKHSSDLLARIYLIASVISDSEGCHVYVQTDNQAFLDDLLNLHLFWPSIAPANAKNLKIEWKLDSAPVELD